MKRFTVVRGTEVIRRKLTTYGAYSSMGVALGQVDYLKEATPEWKGEPYDDWPKAYGKDCEGWYVVVEKTEPEENEYGEVAP